jgi:hypothetical protein
MVKPISSNPGHASEAAKAAAPKPQPAQQKNAPQPSDTVTLKSPNTGNSR